MSPIKQVIHANRFFLASSLPMMKIDIDTIGPIPVDIHGNKYIVVLIDAFSRYISLTPCKDVSAESAARALYLHTCRFGFPTSITTDNGSQYLNHVFEKLSKQHGFTHTRSIPYSKEENGLVERANKEVNRHLRNIIFDKNITDEWSEYLPLIERLFNSSIKEPTGVSPNTIVFGNVIDTNTGFIHEVDTKTKVIPSTNIHTYIDKMIHRQHKLILAAQQNQQQYYTDHNTKQHRHKLDRQYKSKATNQLQTNQLQHHQRLTNIETHKYQPTAYIYDYQLLIYHKSTV
jgi:hypothetical protein